MASASTGPSVGSAWQSKITCRYFIHGLCKAGSKCNYAHDRSKVVNNVCKYFKDGKCFYGQKCKFSHDIPSSQPQPVKSSTASTKTKGIPTPVQSLPSTEAPRKLTPLKPGGTPEVKSPGKTFNFEDVVDVAEFVPGQPYKGSSSIPSSYSSATKKGNPEALEPESTNFPGGTFGSKDILCPFAIKGTCRYGDNCCYTHGGVCEFCNMACLHPFDTEMNAKHTEECIKNHEITMEESFAFQNSKGVSCSICMDVVMEKTNPKDRKFGILTNCTHPFCLECIRKWRSSRDCEKKVVRACPVCRVASNFVCPSDFWVNDEKEKTTLIKNYKDALSKKDCKYFREGNGECPFGANCFYRHAYPDGTLQDRSKIRKYGNGSGKLKTHLPVNLWDFFEERDNWDSDDEDDFFLYGPSFDDWEDSDLEDFYFYQSLFGGSDSDDDSVEDLMLGINMLGLTLVGAAAASLGRDRGGGSREPTVQTSPSQTREDDADDEDDSDNS